MSSARSEFQSPTSPRPRIPPRFWFSTRPPVILAASAGSTLVVGRSLTSSFTSLLRFLDVIVASLSEWMCASSEVATDAVGFGHQEIARMTHSSLSADRICAVGIVIGREAAATYALDHLIHAQAA